MQYSQLANYLQKLENTSKRLEITDILAELLAELNPDETDKALYLSLGYLKAPFASEKFNMADKMVIRTIAQAYSQGEQEITTLYGKTGDLGDVCLELDKTTKKSALSITEVHAELLKIAEYEGAGSQEKKVSALATLLTKIDPLSAKYTVRIVLGTTRLGFTELTVIDALAQSLGDKKIVRKQIEAVYNIHPDIGKLAQVVKQKGLAGLGDIKIETGVPILAQKAQRVGSLAEVIERIPEPWAEFKFDGTRVQLHLDRNKKIDKAAQENLFADTADTFVKTFTRNLEETSNQYPDIVAAAVNQIEAQSVIVDGEAMGYDKETKEFLPFQQIMQRKRKHGVAEMAAEIPLKYFVFDILYLNGEDLTTKTLEQRKEILRKVIKKNGTEDVLVIDDVAKITQLQELQDYFELAREKGLEGLILKDPTKEYQAGARSYAWIKYKVADAKLLDDTVDCVVLGYYFGKGERAKFGIGGFLAGLYDEESGIFKTLTKVGTGLSDDDWRHLKTLCDAVKIKEKPANVDLNKIYNPDVWLNPKVVVELGADEITKSSTHSVGYALRFPRLIKFRPDKKADDTTSVAEILDLYNLQKRGYY